jgi:anti-sigma B factor antagonist
MFELPEVPLRPRLLGTGHSPDDAVIVNVGREIDLLSVPAFSARLTAACAGLARHVLVDLSTVEFVGAAGIQALVDAHRACAHRGIQFGLLNPSSRVLRPLKLLGLDHTIPIHSRLYEYPSHKPASAVA